MGVAGLSTGLFWSSCSVRFRNRCSCCILWVVLPVFLGFICVISCGRCAVIRIFLLKLLFICSACIVAGSFGASLKSNVCG